MDPLFKFFEVHGAIFTLQIKYIQLLIKYEGKKYIELSEMKSYNQ